MTELLALSLPLLASGTAAIAYDREIPICATDVKNIMFKKIE